MKHLCLVIALILAASFEAFPQAAPTFVHTLHGSIKDTNGAAMFGLTIVAEKAGRARRTDENGEFTIDLSPGEYILIVETESLYGFKVFIKITETGPNPDNVEFRIDTTKICCTQADGSSFPVPTSLPRPAYPVPARVVRAFGEVLVSVKIGPDGKVIAAKAESGHPLLRAAAESAGRASRFETSEKAVRAANLFYHFLLADKKPRDGIIQYKNPYFVKRLSDPEIISISSYVKTKRTH